jgi:F-box/WD-40 domain protein MET30
MSKPGSNSESLGVEQHAQSPSKRRRISPPDILFPSNGVSRNFPVPERPTQDLSARHDICSDNHDNISISASSKQASQTVAPFLAEHIPEQYAPGGGWDSSGNAKQRDPNTKFCYRHRPDLKCRRQVNEPSMEQLQNELQDLSHGDQQAIAHVWSLFSAAPAKQRNLILQGILSQCCFPQLSYLSTNVRELIRIDFMTALPPEISYKVLCFLDTTSLCKAAQVSQRWRSLADDDVVWHRMCEQHIDRKCPKCGWGLPLLERQRLRASKRQIQLRATGQGLNEWSPNITPYPEAARDSSPFSLHNDSSDTQEAATSSVDGSERKPATLTVLSPQKQLPTPAGTDDDSYFQPRTRPWKDVYKDRFQVGTNWKHGRCSLRSFKGHTNGVMCLQFSDHLLATGSYDSTIKIWDIDTGEEIRTLKGHTSGIRCLQFDETKLISGSIDRTIKVWNWRTGACISTYTGHSNGVIGLHFDGSVLASGSADKTVKIWNFEDKSKFTLRGHTDWVNAVRVDAPSRTLLSASDDLTLRLWDLDSKSIIKTFEGHVGQVQQVVTLPHDFDFEEVETEDHDDDVSSTTSTPPQPSGRQASTEPILEPYGPGFTTCDRPLPPRYVLTCALDNTIRLWNTYTGKCLRTYFGHVEGVWGLAADSLRVVSGAQDRMIKVWDTRSGKCEVCDSDCYPLW